MNANHKLSVMFVLAVMLAALINGCAGMDNYYTSSTEKVSQTPADSLATEAQAASSAGNYAVAAEKYKQLLDANLCASENDTKGCLLSAKLWLGYLYEKQGKHNEALPYFKEVADSKLAPGETENERLACSAGVMAGKVLMKNNRYDDAFHYFDIADGITGRNSNACNGSNERDDIIHGLANTARGKNDAKRVIGTVKAAYYKKPTSDMYKDYSKILGHAGDKAEMNNVDKFHKKIMPLIEEWEKINAPSGYADESAKIEYNSRRARFYENALRGVKKLGLKGYDDYLIAQVRASREAAESVVASQRYEAEAAESRARQDAEDAAIMNMFMNILTAPRY